jgi:serine/threonine protein kinase
VSDLTSTDDPLLSAPSHPSDIGTLGKYRVLKLLGKGGMGAVFLGYDPSLERHVALKVMLPSFAARPAARERFLREARAAARVKSDFVAPIYEVGEDGGSPFLAMEYLRGQSLEQYLRGEGQPTVAQATRIAREAAAGLAAAHEIGLVHRDVKPANLWLEAPRGRVKLLDFGLVHEQQSNIGLTADGQAVGTPAFMSPEQARGDKVDHRTDLYSLGAVLYLMLTGRLPFPAASAFEAVIRLTTEDVPHVRSLNPDVPDALAELTHRLLAKDPKARPASANEVIAALSPVDAPLAVLDVPVDAVGEPTERIPAVPNHSRRNRRPLVIGVGICMAILASGIIVWRATRPDSRQVPDDVKPAATIPPAKIDSPAPSPQFITSDLSGWEGDKSNWDASDGRLNERARGGKPTVLWSSRPYVDFELRFRIRVDDEKAGIPPAVLFRATPNEDGQLRSFAGAELKFKPGTGVALAARTGGANPKSPLLSKGWFNPGGPDAPKLPSGKELPVVLRCEGKRVTVSLNGENSIDDEFFVLPAEGVIGWTTGGAAGVLISDIQFIDLGRPKAPGPWRPLMVGSDPANWKAAVFGPRQITVDNGQTVVRLGEKAKLESAQSYRDFHLSLEVQTPDPVKPIGNVSYHISAANDQGFQLSMHLPNVFGRLNTWTPNDHATPGEVRNGKIVPRIGSDTIENIPAVRGVVKPVGQWNRMEVICLGDTSLHAVNGRAVFAAVDLRHKGEPVTDGQLVLISYGDMVVRDVKVRSIIAVPEEYGGPKIRK